MVSPLQLSAYLNGQVGSNIAEWRGKYVINAPSVDENMKQIRGQIAEGKRVVDSFLGPLRQLDIHA